MKNLTHGQKFNFNGVEYIFNKESAKNGGETHFYAQVSGAKNIQVKMISWADLAESVASEIVKEAEANGLNPRHVAFKASNPNGKNWEFMSFIAEMKNKFLNANDSIWTRIDNHNKFTAFIIIEVANET